MANRQVSLECNPEIPVAPGVEHYVLDTSLDNFMAQSSSAVILEPPKIKSDTVSIVSHLFAMK